MIMYDMRMFLIFLALLSALALFSGCSGSPALPLPPDWFPAAEGLRRDYRIVGWSHQGRPIFAHIFGQGPECVLLVAGLHGNAPAGSRLLRQFMTHLALHPDRVRNRRVVVVPGLNPDGLARGSKTNARGVDLNRNFPTWNWRPYARAGSRPGSEAEAAAALFCLESFAPARVLVVLSPLFLVSCAGEARDLARRMALTNEYPLSLRPSRGTSGSLGRYTGLLRRLPTVILDLRERDAYEGMWQENVKALEVFVRGE